MVGIGMGVLMSTIDASIVNIALPTLVDELGTSLSTVEWVVLSYLLVLTASMLGVARLGDMYGKKRIYMIGLICFTASSLLCGLAPNAHWLIAFRAIQGIGAVMNQALGTAIITEVFPSSERGRALGIIGSTVSVGISLGPTDGGLIIGLVSWRAAFLINVPLGIATALIVARMVPASPPHAAGQRFDLAGALVLFATLATYALGMTMGQEHGFRHPYILALLAFAVVGLAAFLRLEWTRRHPMIDLRLFRNPLLGINLLMGLIVFIVLASQFLMPFFLQNVQGYRIEQMGLLLAAVPICTGVIAPISGSLSDRFGSRGISLIGLLIVVGPASLSAPPRRHHAPGLRAAHGAPGIGLGFFQSPNNSAIMGTAPRDQLGVVSGMLSLSRTLGQTTGLPLAGSIFTALALAAAHLPAGTPAMSAPPEALVAGLSGTFRLAAAVVSLSAGLAIVAWRLDLRRREAPGSR
jgi:EmrB/QacA subfamily drug resistance transporter